MKFRYPDPDSLSDAAIREALASNAIEGVPLLDPTGRPLPPAERLAAFRERLRSGHASHGLESSQHTLIIYTHREMHSLPMSRQASLKVRAIRCSQENRLGTARLVPV